MNVHILQHVSFEGPGSIQHWLEINNANVSYSRLYEATTVLPEPGHFDLVIIMGGPMSVNDETAYSWLAEEKHFINRAIDAGVAVLGICLGAQLIASAKHAKVFAGPQKEIGWWPIQSAKPPSSCFQFPETSTVFHWHGETFDLPDGATRLASSEVCANQAFQLGRNVIGLQFHMETTEESAQQIITHCGDELVDGDKIQTANTMLTEGPKHYSDINQLMNRVLDYLTRKS